MKRIQIPFAIVLAMVTSPLTAATPDAKPPAPSAPTAATPPKANSSISDLFGNDVVAKGKGVEVKRGQLDDSLITIKSNAAARGQTLPPEQVTLLEWQVLDRMIQIQLLLAKATDADRTKGEDLSSKRFEQLKSRSGTDETFRRQLNSVGMTPETLQKNMKDESVAETVLERELKVNVNDDQVKKFYDENPAKFENPEMVRASHILLGTRDASTGTDLPPEKKNEKHKLAEDLLKRARAGEDFAKLAKEYSEDPGSKDKGGEYTFPRGQMVPEFESAAFSLKTNQVSDIITTQYGYHIIKLLEKIPAKKVDLNTNVVADIRNYLTQQEVQTQLPDYMAKLKKDANVEILDDKLKAAEQKAAEMRAAEGRSIPGATTVITNKAAASTNKAAPPK